MNVSYRFRRNIPTFKISIDDNYVCVYESSIRVRGTYVTHRLPFVLLLLYSVERESLIK